MGMLDSWPGRVQKALPDGDDRDDLDLVHGTLGGRREDFVVLVERHQRSLQRFVEQQVGDRSAADEIVQMSFVQAYTRLASFRAQASFKTWLYSVAMNLCRDRARSEKRRASVAVEDALEMVPSTQPTLEEVVVGATVQRRVAALPDRQRSVLSLRIWGDLSFRDIGALLGISENSAKVSYHHAIRRLKHWLVEAR
jgi:RNA polymerase sigma-70 factor (ECF subfamily)